MRRRGDYELVAFAESPNGGRRRSFSVGDFTVVVEPHERDEKQRAFTEELASALPELAKARAKIRDLEQHIQPKNPVRLLGPGFVRWDGQGQMWLLNNRERGFGEWGVMLDDWDELFRRYSVRVTGAGADEHGSWVQVEPERDQREASRA